MKRGMALVTALLVIVVLAGCAQPAAGPAAEEEAREFSIGIVNFVLGAPYVVAMSDAAEEEAGFYENVTGSTSDAEGDVFHHLLLGSTVFQKHGQGRDLPLRGLGAHQLPQSTPGRKQVLQPPVYGALEQGRAGDPGLHQSRVEKTPARSGQQDIGQDFLHGDSGFPAGDDRSCQLQQERGCAACDPCPEKSQKSRPTPGGPEREGPGQGRSGPHCPEGVQELVGNLVGERVGPGPGRRWASRRGSA